MGSIVPYYEIWSLLFLGVRSFGRLDRKVRILRSWNQNERAAPDMADFSTKQHSRTTIVVTTSIKY
jgi:hypothetical protein